MHSQTVKDIHSMAAAFTVKEVDRGSGTERITTIKEGHEAEELARDFVHTLHGGGLFPDDWIYETASEIADAFSECLEDDEEADRDDLQEWAEEAVQVEIYNSKLLKWVADYSEWVEQALSEFGASTADGGFFSLLQAGQDLQIRQLIYEACEYLEGLDEENEFDDDDE